MSWKLQGIGASPGRVIGEVRRVHRGIDRVPHRTIEPEQVEDELRRFTRAREWALERTSRLRERTEERLGAVEAKIFDPQALMLEDPDLVEGTESYIRENFLSAERAFDWRLLELRSQFLDTAHAMVADRLADLRDIRLRVLGRLLDREVELEPEDDVSGAILAFDELTPSFAVSLEPGRVAGLLTAAGSRASHSAVLARSLEIPAVVGIGDRLQEIESGVDLIMNGSTGRILVDPDAEEIESFEQSLVQTAERRRRLRELADRPSETADGTRIRLRANLDQPDEAEEAVKFGPEGVGLFRSEFLVIGRRTVPGEEEQYEAYRRVVEAFSGDPVTLRTFDIGGDKFPIFLQMPPEENPYLGWRAIRVCLDLPDLFRNQLRAALRAARHGQLRLLLPFVTSVDEVRRARDLLREVREEIEDGDDELDVPVGMMVETPAAVETLDLFAPVVDFLSLGTNDLTQYVVAVDRGNARLADRYDPLHPALFRLYRRLHDAAERHGLPVSVCGDLATDPVGLAVLMGLGYRDFSLPPAAVLEAKEWLGVLDAGELEEICDGLESAETGGEIRAPIRLYLEASAPEDAVLSGRLSRPL